MLLRESLLLHLCICYLELGDKLALVLAREELHPDRWHILQRCGNDGLTTFELESAISDCLGQHWECFT